MVALLTLFIIYGSLYPFTFTQRPDTVGPMSYLLHTWRDWDRRADLLSNILLYFPLGFFVVLVLPKKRSATTRVILSVMACTVLSICMELAQFHDNTRVTSMGDVYANALGSTLGALTSRAFGASLRWTLLAALAEWPNAGLLLVMFLGYRLYPYVPVIDLHKYWRAARGLIQHPVLPLDALASSTATWLLISLLIQTIYGTRLWRWFFPLFVLAEFLGKILIVDAFLPAADVAGAIIVLVIWVAFLGRTSSVTIIVTMAFGGLVIASRLQPFQFSPSLLRSFGWIPFFSLMHGSMNVAIQAFCEKFFQYGGIIWLLNCIKIPLSASTMLTVAVLLLTSYAATYLPGRSAEITDAAVALCVGGAFMLLAKVHVAGSGAALRDIATPLGHDDGLRLRSGRSIGIQVNHAALSVPPNRAEQGTDVTDSSASHVKSGRSLSSDGQMIDRC